MKLEEKIFIPPVHFWLNNLAGKADSNKLVERLFVFTTTGKQILYYYHTLGFK